MLDVERVVPFPTLLLDPDQPGCFQALQVPRRRRPGVTEAVREVTGGHRAAPRVERHEDVTPMLARQRTEDGLELVQLSEATWAPAQRVSRMSKCGNAMPGPMARSSTRVAIRSQSAPIFGW